MQSTNSKNDGFIRSPGCDGGTPDVAEEGPYYSVDIVDRDGPGSWGCRAHSVTEALRKAERAHLGRNCRVDGAEFDKFHLENRLPDSEIKIYRGKPLVACETYVYVTHSKSSFCNDLDPRLDLANHSPTGLSWGYQGSGPAQLSLALLADALEDDARALKIYQPFKFAYIARMPATQEWVLSSNMIRLLACITERQMASFKAQPAAGLPVQTNNNGNPQ